MAALSTEHVGANVAEIRERIAGAARRSGRRPEDVRLLAAVKYLASEDLGALADAGLDLVGENRAQELVLKATAWPERFHWHFIGRLQSRKVKMLAPHVDLIHSLASESAVRELERHARPGLEVLIEVNIAREPGKAGVDVAAIDRLIECCPVPVVGLMTMPPLGGESRRWFSALRDEADARGLEVLSMGTSHDYEVAVEEGATIVRIGSSLYR